VIPATMLRCAFRPHDIHHLKEEDQKSLVDLAGKRWLKTRSLSFSLETDAEHIHPARSFGSGHCEGRADMATLKIYTNLRLAFAKC
jgi:hypothetical protein